jgi:hypothetical protein
MRSLASIRFCAALVLLASGRLAYAEPEFPETKQAASVLLDRIVPDVFVDTHYFNRRPEALLECRQAIGDLLDHNLQE